MTVGAETILEKLVSFGAVVGSGNAGIAGFVKDTAQAAGGRVRVLAGPEGDRANVFVAVGPEDVPGYILSGHMDVVAANEEGWQSDPFVLRRDGERLYARGSSDMQGFLACALAALPDLAKKDLKRPVHLAFSYDEEAGCRGVPHMIAALPQLCAPPLGCVVGEPSGMNAIRAHKGKAAMRLTVIGRAGHSSRPDSGLNSIHAMTRVLEAATEKANALSAEPLDDMFTPAYSTLQVGTIGGGSAVNVIPDRCAIDLEARAIPGVSPSELLEPVKQAGEALKAEGFEIHIEMLSQYPAMSLSGDAPLALLMEEILGKPSIPAVSYGTEAGLFQAAGIPSIICGPGDISRAHRANEYVEIGELRACSHMIAALAQRINA